MNESIAVALMPVEARSALRTERRAANVVVRVFHRVPSDGPGYPAARSETMTEDKERELEKRVEDIRAIRQLLAEGDEIPLVHPWAFMVWAFLVGGGIGRPLSAFPEIGHRGQNGTRLDLAPGPHPGSPGREHFLGVRLNKRALPLFNRRPRRRHPRPPWLR